MGDRPDKTRVVRLKTGKLRDNAVNAETMIIDLDPSFTEASFRRLFVRHYEKIQQLCQGFARQGLALVAISQKQLEATACLATKTDQINTAIIGRHGMTDLFLDGDPGLSLRHLAVILHPHNPGGDSRFRLVDLRTTAAFLDEKGRRLEALEAEGPVFVACGRHALFFLPTGDELPWPDSPDEGWACIPDRVYLDDTLAEPDRWHRRRRHAQARSGGQPPQKGRTLVQTFQGPAHARRRLLRDHEDPLGQLEIRSSSGSNTIIIGPAAADQGVLLGRYDRCDTEGLPVLSHESISRVHLLVIRINGRLYAVDVASTNGVFAGHEEIRIQELGFGQQLVLGKELATLTWQPVH